MKKYLYLFFVALPLLALTACEDNTDTQDDTEFSENWQYRNTLYFVERMNEAREAIAQAKSTYGDKWEDHCDWRMFRSYAKPAGGPTFDSICVRIVERGTGSGCPMYTDSVKINYIGRLIPTESYAEGKAFDYSGLYEGEDYVFNPNFATPVAMAVNNVVEGFGTALMYMHIGDRWKMYLPQELAYQSTSTTLIPSYSTLMFEVQLKSFYRAGESASE